MAIQIGGWSVGTIGEVDAAPKALHVTERPTDYGSRGSFAASLPNNGSQGSLAFANGNIAGIFIWRVPFGVCLVRRITVSFNGANAFTTAGVMTFKLWVSRFTSTVSSLGNAAILPNSNVNATTSHRNRTSMQSTNLTDFRVQSTNAPGAVATLDAQPLAAIATSVTAAAGQNPIPHLELWRARRGQTPIMLTISEALIYRLELTPGGGSSKATIGVEWDEVLGY